MTLSLSSPRPRWTGAALSLVGLALAFNLPFAWLGAVFDYPDILRRPPAEILEAFAAGGPGLVLAWYGFQFVQLLGERSNLIETRAAQAAPLEQAAKVRGALGRVIFGQRQVIDETLVTLLAGGHLLVHRDWWRPIWKRVPTPVVGVACGLVVLLALLFAPAESKLFIYFQF